MNAFGSALSAPRLARLKWAADEVRDILTELSHAGRHVITDLIGDRRFTIGDHYPLDDVYDPTTGAQFFYHAHPAEPRPHADGSRVLIEHGHFHLLMDRDRAPAGATPLKGPPPRAEPWDQCHLVALGIDTTGAATHLFTLNQWLSREWLFPAPVVLDMLDRFTIDDPKLRTPAVRWVVAMAALFQPQIAELLGRRDEVLKTRAPGPGSRSIFDDEGLEITSFMEIDLDQQIADVDRAYAERFS